MQSTSAVAFVGVCTKAIAFVISQDGPVRAFVRQDDQTVLCWPNCSTSMIV
jgi:hypothetical protein